MTAQHFLEKHPTPWRFICETDLSDSGEKSESIEYGYHDARQCDHEKRDVVEDANGNIVFASWDRDETASHFDGDVRGLVDFINALGPRLPRLIQLDIQEKMRGVMRWENIERADEDELLRRINNLENRGDGSARQ